MARQPVDQDPYRSPQTQPCWIAGRDWPYKATNRQGGFAEAEGSEQEAKMMPGVGTESRQALSNTSAPTTAIWSRFLGLTLETLKVLMISRVCPETL
jgi:hypothetical protein